jgi:hypothetical protein
MEIWEEKGADFFGKPTKVSMSNDIKYMNVLFEVGNYI